MSQSFDIEKTVVPLMQLFKKEGPTSATFIKARERAGISAEEFEEHRPFWEKVTNTMLSPFPAHGDQ